MSTKDRRIREKEQRRMNIIHSARKIFFNNGYSGASMEMIADESQLSKGTLYLYFRSKDDLYYSLLEEGMALLEKMVSEAEDPEILPEESLLKFAETYFRFSEKHSEYFRIISTMDMCVNTGDNINHGTIDRIRQLEERIFLKIVNKLNEGIDSGRFGPHFSACYTFLQLWISLTGAIEMYKKTNKPKMLENVDPLLLVTDITKTFIIAHTNSQELIEKYKNELMENAYMQAPSDIEIHKRNIS